VEQSPHNAVGRRVGEFDEMDMHFDDENHDEGEEDLESRHLIEDHEDEDHEDEDHEDEDHEDEDHEDEDHEDEDHEDEDHEDEDHEDGDHEDEDHEDEDHESHNEASEIHSDEKPWSEVIIASLLVNLATLAGLVVLSGKFLTKICCKSRATPSSSSRWTQNIIPSFACGALLATCAFLILPESVAMITSHFGGGHDTHRTLEEDAEEDAEAQVAWRFGASLIGGFLLPIVSSFLFPHYHEPDFCDTYVEENNEVIIEETNLELANAVVLGSKNDLPVKDDASSSSRDPSMTIGEGCEPAGCENHDEELAATPELTVTLEEKPLSHSTRINYSLASSVLLGDFFHNFTDGVLIGTAFSLCQRELAIAISVSTVYHELAQEIADFFLLTEHCHIRPAVALLLNFVGGLSVLFGAILILSMDVSANATGCILAIGSGVYIYIAVGECLPRARQAQKTATDKAISVASFVVGVIPIGLVLLNHGHCEAH
jgi:zinc transporter ZupT